MPDDHGPVDAEAHDELVHLRCHIVQVGGRAVALAVRGQVDGDASASIRSMIGRQLVRSNVRPCIKMMGGGAVALVRESRHRGVAADVGTTTRAVYSVFGSKDGLVAALAARAFELLHEGLEALPVTDDPGADLVEAGLLFRRFSTGHPSLFALGFQRALPTPAVRRTAWEALAVLQQRLQRLADAGRLGGRTVEAATQQFDALCEGLAVVELRGSYPLGGGEEMWRGALGALVAGFAAPLR